MTDRPQDTDDLSRSPAADDLDRLPVEEELDRLQATTVLYYLHESNPDNGLVRDKNDPDGPCSNAAVGLALASIPVIVERAVVIRKFAARFVRRQLRYLLELPQGPEPGAAGHKGFFYHFAAQGKLLPYRRPSRRVRWSWPMPLRVGPQVRLHPTL